MFCILKRFFTLMLCALLVISATGCSSNNEDEEVDSRPSSGKVSNNAGFDSNYERLVINGFELNEDDYMIKKKGRDDYLLIDSEVFKWAFRIPYVINGYPELNWDDQGLIDIIWENNESIIIEAELQEDSPEAVVNGESADLGISPIIEADVLYIPANMFITLLEMETTYDRKLKTLFVERSEDFPKDLLIGKWSDTTTNIFMGVKDLTTGIVDLPSFTEGYSFNEDGTFRLIMVSVGGFEDALLENSGRYKIIGNTVVCYDIRETLYEGTPFELVHKEKLLDDPSYEFISNYDPDENKIEITFWLNKIE